MLIGVTKAQLYADAADWIRSEDARDAFGLLIGRAVSLRDYHCELEQHATKRTFKFCDARNNQPFAAIVNRKWLLFYFRLPSQSHRKYSSGRIEEAFPDVFENALGELTIKLRTVGDVQRLWKFLDLR